MMPAAKHFDPVLGVDIHIIQPPGPVPPLPIPHPFVGFIIDPFDYVPILGSTVNVNGVPRAQAGTAGKAVPSHIPIGGVFVKPPANECEMFMGSSTVSVDGDAFSYLALPALSCQCIGMPPIPRINPKKKSKVKSLVLPTSVVLPIPAGPPVLVGGAPTISLMALGMKVGMAALGRAFRRLRQLQRASRRWQAISRRMRQAASAVLDRVPGGQRARNAVNRGICTLTGHPVDVATGKVVTNAVDFELSGPIPLRFERIWYSTSTHRGPVGHGWHVSINMALTVYPEGVLARLADGRYAGFGHPGRDVPSWNPREKLALRLRAGGYALETGSGLQYRFAAPSNPSSGELPLAEIADPNGNRIVFEWRGGRVAAITDSVGRHLSLRHDEAGRIVQIRLDAPHGPDEPRILVSYRYSPDGDLLEVIDPLGQATRFEYDGHLLVREIDRKGLSYYFKYDGPGPEARCIRTWGDGGLHSRDLTYNLAANRTTVVDSTGATALFDWNDLGLVTREVDAAGVEWRFEWDEDGNKLAETNPLGATKSYDYDARGRVTAFMGPTGARTEYAYNEAGDLIARTDAAGHTWRFEYDQWRNEVAQIDPTGQVKRIRVDDRGRPIEVTDPLGRTTQLTWGPLGTLDRVVDRGGGQTRMEHDLMGRLVRRTDPLGRVTRLEWDACGRLVGSVDASGRRARYERDPEGNLAVFINPRGRVARFKFGPGRRVLWVKAPSGRTRTYRYDTEMRLVEVRVDGGRSWRIERDLAGRVVREVTFDGRKLSYCHDARGLLREFINARGQRIAYERDPAGRLTAIHYPHGEVETFEHDAVARLVRAHGPSVSVTRQYDARGRLVEEQLNGRTTRSEFDALGNRTRRRSPFGRTIRFRYDPMDRLEAVSDGAEEMLSMAYDSAGQEVRRTLRGGLVHERCYTETGELSRTVTARVDETQVARTYRYNDSRQLVALDDSGFGRSTFDYDEDDWLAAAAYPDLEVERFAYDVAGNVPGAPRDQPPQGRSGSVIHEGSWRLLYDADGNLVEKRGRAVCWRYFYDAVGRLRGAWRRDPNVPGPEHDPGALTPDAPVPTRLLPGPEQIGGGELLVEFRYDPFDRRVLKEVTEPGHGRSRVEYVWDGNTLVGERRVGGASSPGAPREIEYVFRPGGIEPLAILGGDGCRLIEPDHLGTPRAAYDCDGRVVWEASFRAFGRLRKPGERGDAGAVPFRFPGQYEDSETGLCYNRFRYYDPDLRQYTTPDPIGLRGGWEPWNYVRSPLSWVDPWGLSEDEPPTRRTQTPGDTTHGTRGEAFDEALRSHGVDPHQPYDVEVREMYGQNANLRGPRGEPYEVVSVVHQTPDGNLNTVEIDHHSHGHHFADNNTFEYPHYHGPGGTHHSYTC